MANGFSEGLSSSLAGNLEQVNKNRLELTMKSKAIEMELKKRAAEMAQDEGRNFIRPEDWNPLIQGINPSIKEIPQFSSSVPQQAYLKSQLPLPAIEAKGLFAPKRTQDTLGEDWARNLAEQIPGGLSEEQIMRIARSPKSTAFTYAKMYIKNPAVQKDMADRVSGLQALPGLFQNLTTLTSGTGFFDKAKLFVAQYGASSPSLIPKMAAEMAAPGITQAFNAAVRLMQFGEGGKTLTSAEQEAVNSLLLSPAYGPESVERAKTQFVNILKNRITEVLKSGAVSDWRGTLLRTNDALMDLGMDPITLDESTIINEMPARRKAKKPLAELLKENGL